VRVLTKTLEKDRNLRCQTATELKTDLNRLKRDLELGKRTSKDKPDSDPGISRQSGKSVAVLYFENLSGAKEDEYLRDGITEDVITELSKIRGLNTFSRPTVLAFRDKPVTPHRLASSLGPPMFLRAPCGGPVPACGLVLNSLTLIPISPCGRNDSTAR